MGWATHSKQGTITRLPQTDDLLPACQGHEMDVRVRMRDAPVRLEVGDDAI